MVELRKNWKTGVWILAFLIIDWVVLKDIVETVFRIGNN
jgi:uncharacterized membrane protein